MKKLLLLLLLLLGGLLLSVQAQDQFLSGTSTTSGSSSSSGASLPLKRYVYLVNDTTDATRLGGSTANAYTSFQSAYNAANTLAQGSTNVVILVGSTTAAGVGNLVLAAAHNTAVSYSGLNKAASVIGNIFGTNASGDGFAVNFDFANMAIGSVTTSTSANGGNTSGAITIRGNGLGACAIGAVDTHNAAATDNGGTVTLTDLTHTTIRSDSAQSTAGDVTLLRTSGTSINCSSAGGNGAAASLTRAILSGTITTDGSTTAGSITLSQNSSCGNYSCTGSQALVSIDHSTTGNGTFSGNGDMTLTATKSEIGGILNSGINGNTQITLIDCIVIPSGTNNAIQLAQGGGFNIEGCRIVTESTNTIGSFTDTSGVAQIKRSTLIQNTSGAPLGGAGGGILIVDGVQTKADFNRVDFTVSGNYSFNTAYQ